MSNTEANSNALLVIISAPSGGGKTTIAHELISRFPGSKRCITSTTRPARSTEIPDQDYHFISDEKFDEILSQDGFAEWATVHNYRYGTPKQQIKDALDNKQMLFLTVDVQGAESFKKLYAEKTLSVFVSPPDFDILETRLRKRGTEEDGEIRRRLENARKEIAKANEFDYQVLNDRLERAVLEIESIIKKRIA